MKKLSDDQIKKINELSPNEWQTNEQGITYFTYLHELQNLHYEFTREMLPLKSKEK